MISLFESETPPKGVNKMLKRLFAGVFQWLAAVGVGAAFAVADYVLAQAQAVPVDTTTLDGLLLVGVAAIITKLVTALVGLIPNPENPNPPPA